MFEIGCLACSKTMKMPQYIDTEKYNGLLFVKSIILYCLLNWQKG
jgi:hypothetical protein